MASTVTSVALMVSVDKCSTIWKSHKQASKQKYVTGSSDGYCRPTALTIGFPVLRPSSRWSCFNTPYLFPALASFWLVEEIITCVLFRRAMILQSRRSTWWCGLAIGYTFLIKPAHSLKPCTSQHVSPR